MPFIGCLLSNTGERDIAPVELISFLTQKLILTAIYEKWDKVTVSTAAEKLGVSKTSASRCFDEIEYLNVNILDTKGKSRAITIPPDVKQLWKQIQHILRNPVIPPIFQVCQVINLTISQFQNSIPMTGTDLYLRFRRNVFYILRHN